MRSLLGGHEITIKIGRAATSVMNFRANLERKVSPVGSDNSKMPRWPGIENYVNGDFSNNTGKIMGIFHKYTVYPGYM